MSKWITCIYKERSFNRLKILSTSKVSAIILAFLYPCKNMTMTVNWQKEFHINWRYDARHAIHSRYNIFRYDTEKWKDLEDTQWAYVLLVRYLTYTNWINTKHVKDVTVNTISTLFHLQDLLENDDISLDWMFKLSIIMDVANVSSSILKWVSFLCIQRKGTSR